jgi:hypothetical protein
VLQHAGGERIRRVVTWEATLERSWWPVLRAVYANPDTAQSQNMEP